MFLFFCSAKLERKNSVSGGGGAPGKKKGKETVMHVEIDVEVPGALDALFDKTAKSKKALDIEVLNITNKELIVLSGKISVFVNLRVLNVSGNKLAGVCDEIGSLEKLEHLGLNENHIKKLPTTIGQLKSLKTLDCRFNRLPKIPAEVGKKRH